MQFGAAERPVEEQLVPTGQGRHWVKLSAGAYEPAAHGMDMFMPELGQAEPRGQEAHTDKPVVGAYAPAMHVRQAVVGSVPYVPTVQLMYAVMFDLRHVVPAGQGRHAT